MFFLIYIFLACDFYVSGIDFKSPGSVDQRNLHGALLSHTAFYYLGLHKAVVKITNGLSAAMHRTSSILLKSSEYAFHAKRFQGVQVCCSLFDLYTFIGIPGLLKGVVSAKYMDTVACVRNLYLSMEQGTVEKAKQYDPLIKPSKTKKKKSTEAEKKEKQEESEEILLSLTGEGFPERISARAPGQNMTA